MRVANHAAGIVVGKLGTAVAIATSSTRACREDESLTPQASRLTPMSLIVTGAAGFIGSNLVRALNARGETDIVAVDNLSRADKIANLADLEIADYIDKRDFLDAHAAAASTATSPRCCTRAPAPTPWRPTGAT